MAAYYVFAKIHFYWLFLGLQNLSILRGCSLYKSIAAALFMKQPAPISLHRNCLVNYKPPMEQNIKYHYNFTLSYQ